MPVVMPEAAVVVAVAAVVVVAVAMVAVRDGDIHRNPNKFPEKPLPAIRYPPDPHSVIHQKTH